MFELGGVAALHVAEWWVRLNDSLLAQVLQCHLKQITRGVRQVSRAVQGDMEKLHQIFGINKK